MDLFAAALQDTCNSHVQVAVTATSACSHGLTLNQCMAPSQGLAPSQGMGHSQGIAAIEELQALSSDDCMNKFEDVAVSTPIHHLRQTPEYVSRDTRNLLVPELHGTQVEPEAAPLQRTHIQFVDGDNCAVHSPPMHPFTVIPLGFGAELLDYIGAHHRIRGSRWDCDHCSPRWYDWWCNACRNAVPSRWTVENHFGQCVQSCPCCRARVDCPLSCAECFSIACVQMVDKICRDDVLCARAAGAQL